VQGLANLADDRIDARLHIDEDVLAPQLIDDVTAGDELTSTFDEKDEEIHRLSFESDRAAVTAQRVRRDIELEVAKAKRLTRIGHPRSSETPQIVSGLLLGA
jgi:hypothetical protein